MTTSRDAAGGPSIDSLTLALAEYSGLISMGRILCVDDEPHSAKLKCIILETAGHQATPATSAREAITLMESNLYDVVVTDWRLGDANGRDIVVAARRQADTPVVVISGFVNEAFQAEDPLADYYLEKPVNPEELISVVNDLVNAGQTRS
jgi:two-component system response regulator HydG